VKRKRTRQERIDNLFKRADKQSEAGNLRSAFRLMLAAAKLGECSCQINVGTFYSDGIGVKPNRARGLYWYCTGIGGPIGRGSDRIKAVPLLMDVWKTAPPFWITEEDQQEARRPVKQLGIVPAKSARGRRRGPPVTIPHTPSTRK